MNSFIALIEAFADAKGAELAPNWSRNVEADDIALDDPEGLEHFCARLGWKAPIRLRGRPRANQFPLLMFGPRGWAVAEQWETLDSVRIREGNGEIRDVDSHTHFFDLRMPRIRDREAHPRAISVFWRSLLLRKKVFASAILATVIVNLIALATSLYSMQVYDRVIPRGGFATLWVLTVGVIFALFLDFLLRTTRALMIEREAQAVDAEVSEFFFARAQAIRLDARPPSVGTMASQLRGWEQIRALLSSASIFLVADLPFALFFIVVISSLGGIIAVVPLVSFPVALLLAALIARMIRKDTAKAQVSGNRKNGLLVEMLDAAETVKANRGSWHVLGRWNALMDEVHLHEDPVKRWSAIAGSVFATMQQISYVLLVAWGAVLVAEGEMTAGALIACAIIAGRVNGPLVAQLPSFLVQWGYARSALEALDKIMELPLDQAPGVESLRPARLDGPIRLENVQFAYPGARSGIDVPQLEIRPGERVAIIGGIGSGKSTLLRLAAGLFAPASGNVTIGGLDMGQIAPDILRRHIGYLPQDTRLLNGTLRDNVLLGLSDPGDDKLTETIAEVGLAQMIAGHPNGLDLEISEGGRGLSGGQRTLANLTRLFLADPQVWLLDEPTANLDQATESRVLAALQRRLSDSRTLVMITHRMQLLSLSQRVIVVSNGKISMDGPTAQVVAKLKERSKAAPPVRLAAASGA